MRWTLALFLAVLLVTVPAAAGAQLRTKEIALIRLPKEGTVVVSAVKDGTAPARLSVYLVDADTDFNEIFLISRYEVEIWLYSVEPLLLDTTKAPTGETLQTSARVLRGQHNSLHFDRVADSRAAKFSLIALGLISSVNLDLSLPESRRLVAAVTRGLESMRAMDAP